MEASLAHSISDALSPVSLLSLCSWLALFQSRFPSSSPLFAQHPFPLPSTLAGCHPPVHCLSVWLPEPLPSCSHLHIDVETIGPGPMPCLQPLETPY